MNTTKIHTQQEPSEAQSLKLHPLHGALKKPIKVQMPDGSIKIMKAKTALQKGYIKTT